MRKRLLFLGMLVGFSFCVSTAIHAAETRDEREAKEAADEDAAEGQKGEENKDSKSYTGRFSVEINDKQPADVIGSLTTDNATYIVRTTDQALMKRLIAKDRQKCVLFGKLRNKGKYLVVSSIIEPEPAVGERRKRGGL